MDLERMDDFFNARAEGYDKHMLDDLELDVFYEEIAQLISPVRSDFRLLDLGCGTGIELERLYAEYPDMQVTGVDLSAGMLEQMKTKFSNKNLNLICGSYFDVDFGNGLDIVLSTYSLHHFDEENKCGLYRKIYKSLAPGGIFIFGDYIVASQQNQDDLVNENNRLRKKNGIPDCEFYHFDIPFTVENEVKIMKKAGFSSVKVIRKWENTGIITAERD